ncbi:hypothetical protein Poly21_13930 [Allorhodopirellula heiligendammensis]|uniref:Uncharacterized protein n=1 Tax=Allorhodopirellula heiligendammensis TaxID=2714739 RepID=A0A5C6C546_9BACT|nr:hypothetical protein Poly21_13930 [Allorhodopirellula heiligendammensis]
MFKGFVQEGRLMIGGVLVKRMGFASTFYS